MIRARNKQLENIANRTLSLRSQFNFDRFNNFTFTNNDILQIEVEDITTEELEDTLLGLVETYNFIYPNQAIGIIMVLSYSTLSKVLAECYFHHYNGGSELSQIADTYHFLDSIELCKPMTVEQKKVENIQKYLYDQAIHNTRVATNIKDLLLYSHKFKRNYLLENEKPHINFNTILNNIPIANQILHQFTIKEGNLMKVKSCLENEIRLFNRDNWNNQLKYIACINPSVFDGMTSVSMYSYTKDFSNLTTLKCMASLTREIKNLVDVKNKSVSNPIISIYDKILHQNPIIATNIKNVFIR